jgi:predicted CoA-binding protein
MTKILEDLLNLPSMAEIKEVEHIPELPDETITTLEEIDNAIDKIDVALPTVRDLDASDKEMDELAALATNTFKDLMELSFNVEPRFSGPIIQSASSILGHAVTAKMAKIDKKLKMVDLQLKKARLDKTTKEPTEGKEVNGEGILLDRNTLLKEILANSSKN